MTYAGTAENDLRNIWDNHGLSIALAILFIISWGGQMFFQWHEFINDSIDHGEIPNTDKFIPAFWAATFENWQSEFLQLFTFVVLSAVLIHRGSANSKDTTEDIQRTLQRIERRLSAMEDRYRR
ncbi:MAG: hypothetical protein HY364_01900 [Candidatus Aenigmarchaeota archaeon]|nr:hypothetical protein [Candidatus Aenigmarchaeota archaeon]